MFDPVYMVFDALHGVYMVERGVAQLDPRLAGEKNSPPCRPKSLLVESFTWSKRVIYMVIQNETKFIYMGLHAEMLCAM